ncbi:MAG: alpha/beta hydrolase family protein [Rhodocyclaceae bacterium]|nr:alpha/beta hydrolase family protein [Rhodocyclaceae bacterium]
MKSSNHRILFFPGASGDGSFWTGVGELLPNSWQKHYLNWPGLGNQPASPEVTGFTDLLRLTERSLSEPSAIVAQSMGGIVAIQLALKHPDLVTHLVLVATSGGLDVSSFGASDWRPDFLAAFPETAQWILTERPDLAGQFSKLQMPTLLIWGEKDAISPVAVGQHLATQIPLSRLFIVPGGEHSLAKDLPEVVVPLIETHLATV